MRPHIIYISLLSLLALASCARMGQPDGGWYDETPPHIVAARPADRAVGISSRRVTIDFDEMVKIDNATENVVVSPPQLEMPDIRCSGRRITVALKDTLRPETTYTIDFSDAITDNNESNPLGNYTYTFSTGTEIDTMQVAGYVLEAEDLEPVKGVLVGLYDDPSDTAFTTRPMLRVARTDGSGHFVIKGVRQGTYRVFALGDTDGDFRRSQKGEKTAFYERMVTTACKPDIRQDTIWRDSLRIDSIARVPYTHFLPDDLVLRAFTETLTDRYLVKSERPRGDHFTFYFSYGSEKLPQLRGLNFDTTPETFLTQASERRDTVTYWLRDTTLANRDTLRLEVQYEMSDTLGQLLLQTDTLELLAKETYAKRVKTQQKKAAEWKKRQEKAKKRGEPYEEAMPPEPLRPRKEPGGTLDPDRNIRLAFETPVGHIDTTLIHLYAKVDTTWQETRFQVRDVAGQLLQREIRAEWQPGTEYSLEMDSTAFADIYGRVTGRTKDGFRVRSLDDYSSLVMRIHGVEDTPLVCELLDSSDKVVKRSTAHDGVAEFYYVAPATYYLRMIADTNGNGRWDTGCYADTLQPEQVYYYPEKIECKAKWDVAQEWTPTRRPLYQQKPAALTRQKADRKKSITNRNAKRAADKGLTDWPGKYGTE